MRCPEAFSALVASMVLDSLEKGSGTLADRKRPESDMSVDRSGQQVTLYCDLRASAPQASCLYDGILTLREAEVQVLINTQLQHCGYRLQGLDKILGKVPHGAKALKVPIFMADHARPGLKVRK